MIVCMPITSSSDMYLSKGRVKIIFRTGDAFHHIFILHLVDIHDQIRPGWGIIDKMFVTTSIYLLTFSPSPPFFHPSQALLSCFQLFYMFRTPFPVIFREESPGLLPIPKRNIVLPCYAESKKNCSKTSLCCEKLV